MRKVYCSKISRIIIVIIILFIMIINSSCLTLQYYPAKVAEPGKAYLGFGIHEETFDGLEGDYIVNYPVFDAIFFRRGLPNNFDIGFDIHAVTIIPYMLSISGRKQIDISDDSNDLIHSITFDIGCGIALVPQCHTSISFFKNDYALTFGLKKYVLMTGPGSSYSDAFRNEFLIKVSKDSKDKRFHVMPFLYYKAVQGYNTETYKEDLTYISRTGWSNKQIGIGISFYFDLFKSRKEMI